MEEQRTTRNSFNKCSRASFKTPNKKHKKNGTGWIKQAQKNYEANLNRMLTDALKEAEAAPKSRICFKRVKTFHSKLLQRGNLDFNELTLISESRRFINQAQKIHGN